MAKLMINLRAETVETKSGACPSLYVGTSTTDDEIEVRFCDGTLKVSRNGAEVFEGDVADATNSETCDLATACRAAGINLLAEGEAPPTAISAADVVTACGACPTVFEAVDLASGDDVELHYRSGTLTVTRAYREIFSGRIPGASADGFCSIEDACEAAGISLVD